MNRVHIGADVLKEMEHVIVTIRENLKVAQDRKRAM